MAVLNANTTAPVNGQRFCVLYLCAGKERRSPWFNSRERAARARRIIEKRVGEENTCIYVD